MDRYTIELKKDDDSKIIINKQPKEINMTVSEQIVLTNVKTQAKSVTPTESAQTITPDQEYDALSSVDVGAIDSSYVGSAIQRRSSSNLTVSGASVTAPAGYYSSAATKSVATATQATPQVSINSTTGLVTATATQSTGYVNGGTASDELQLSVQAAKIITPSTSQQTAVQAGKYTTGNVTVNPIPSQYIVPSGNIAITENGTGIDVSQYATASVNVSSGGSTKNVQAYRGYDYVQSTSYTATDVTITVAKTGTYNVSWMGYRNTTSGTSGSQLYKNGTAVGSASTSFINSYGHYVSLTNQSFNEGDVLVVRARSRSTSYYMGVGNLIIEEV